MSIAMSVVEIVESAMREKNASVVRSVTLDVGELSGVMPNAVAFCYEAAANGTALEGSKLVINHVKARARCAVCDIEFAPDDRFVICPQCQGFGGTLIAGEELMVREVEME